MVYFENWKTGSLRDIDPLVSTSFQWIIQSILHTPSGQQTYEFGELWLLNLLYRGQCASFLGWLTVEATIYTSCKTLTRLREEPNIYNDCGEAEEPTRSGGVFTEITDAALLPADTRIA